MSRLHWRCCQENQVPARIFTKGNIGHNSLPSMRSNTTTGCMRRDNFEQIDFRSDLLHAYTAILVTPSVTTNGHAANLSFTLNQDDPRFRTCLLSKAEAKIRLNHVDIKEGDVILVAGTDYVDKPHLGIFRHIVCLKDGSDPMIGYILPNNETVRKPHENLTQIVITKATQSKKLLVIPISYFGKKVKVMELNKDEDVAIL